MIWGINWGARWRVYVVERKSDRDNHGKEEDRPGKWAEGQGETDQQQEKSKRGEERRGEARGRDKKRKWRKEGGKKQS